MHDRTKQSANVKECQTRSLYSSTAAMSSHYSIYIKKQGSISCTYELCENLVKTPSVGICPTKKLVETLLQSIGWRVKRTSKFKK